MEKIERETTCEVSIGRVVSNMEPDYFSIVFRNRKQGFRYEVKMTAEQFANVMTSRIESYIPIIIEMDEE